MPEQASQHIVDHEMAAFLEGRLSGEARDAVVAHLAECADCRAEYADAKRILGSGTRRARVAAVMGLAAAAAIAGILLPFEPPATMGDERLLRSGGEDAALTVYGPLGELESPPRLLVWESAGPNTLYRVSVTLEDGAPIWRASTEDTTLVVPDSVALAPAVAYRWWVDAVLSDGVTRTSGVRGFRVEP